jgi:hypothetical protein
MTEPAHGQVELAIGRTTSLHAVCEHAAGRLTRGAAIEPIAARYHRIIDVYAR